MSDGALKQLESVRREAVERARQALTRARREYDAAAAAWRKALAEEQSGDAQLREAHASFVRAGSVHDLRRASLLIDGARQLSRTSAARAVQLTQQLADLRAKVREASRELQAAELGEKVVERVLDRRAREVSRRTEQRAEDEHDDAFRTRFQG